MAAQPGEARSVALPKQGAAGGKREPWTLLEPEAEAERKEAESERSHDVRSAA